MNRPLALILSLALTGIFSVGCQTTASDPKLSQRKPAPADPLPAWVNTSSKAKGDQQILITTKLIEISRPAGAEDVPTKRYERRLTDPDFQKFLRAISQQKGSDLMTAPSVVTRDGQTATIEVIREFVYPTGPGADAKHEIENVGVTSYIEASHRGGDNIAVKTFTRVTEFDGFPAASPGFQLPVFDRRDVETAAHLKNGETFLVGGIVDQQSQEIEDAGPLGLIKKRTTGHFTRELIIAVTATLVRPDGTRVASL